MKSSFIRNLISKKERDFGKNVFYSKADSEEDIKHSLGNLTKRVEAKHSHENYHQTIGRMSAFFAHEIRNPLTSIIGFAQFLEQDEMVRSQANLLEYIAIIKEEALKMEVLIKELLNLSKAHLDQDYLSLIDVKQSIDKIISIYQMQDKFKQIKFQTHLVDDCYILGNIQQFEQVLINLFKNAIEAMQEKGIIEINLSKHSSVMLLEIIDHGPGIAVEDLERIFFPFYTTKEEGTGIGLPICKTIIEAMNGSMEIYNHATKGIHVVISIPQSKQSHYSSLEDTY